MPLFPLCQYFPLFSLMVFPYFFCFHVFHYFPCYYCSIIFLYAPLWFALVGSLDEPSHPVQTTSSVPKDFHRLREGAACAAAAPASAGEAGSAASEAARFSLPLAFAAMGARRPCPSQPDGLSRSNGYGTQRWGGREG